LQIPALQFNLFFYGLGLRDCHFQVLQIKGYQVIVAWESRWKANRRSRCFLWM